MPPSRRLSREERLTAAAKRVAAEKAEAAKEQATAPSAEAGSSTATALADIASPTTIDAKIEAQKRMLQEERERRRQRDELRAKALESAATPSVTEQLSVADAVEVTQAALAVAVDPPTRPTLTPTTSVAPAVHSPSPVPPGTLGPSSISSAASAVQHIASGPKAEPPADSQKLSLSNQLQLAAVAVTAVAVLVIVARRLRRDGRS